MNVLSPKINFCSTRNSGSPFWDSKHKFSFFPRILKFQSILSSRHSECPAEIPNVRPRFRMSGRDSECPAEIPNVRRRFRMSSRDSECPAEIPNVGGLECWKRATFLHFLGFWNSSPDSVDYSDSAGTVSGSAVQKPQTTRRSLRMT